MHATESEQASDHDFQFLSGNSSMNVLTADELFFEGGSFLSFLAGATDGV